MFLPVCEKDMRDRAWDALDIILVSGDAYVDHPSYAAAVIGRALEDKGFKVGIIAQPDWRLKESFTVLGRPKLFFGVTAGNLDSMVANYTANRKPRSSDEYAPGGKAGLRPDRATLIYTNKIKEAFPGVPVVLGGIEASMRRLAHYDYWSDTVKRSLVLDAKADILVYGMGESQVTQIATRMANGESVKKLDDVPGTVIVRNDISAFKDYVTIPSFEDVSADMDMFNASYKTIYAEADPVRGKAIIQKHAQRYVIQLPPAKPLESGDLDRIYALGYERAWHPQYDGAGGVPGFETVRNSIISHRGCSGGCNFCSLYLHQGRIVQSRSEASIVQEATEMAARKDFRGTITDIGGPTANMYKAACPKWRSTGACRDKACIMPGKCSSFKLGYDETVKLWSRVRKIDGVKHVFISSGLRYDLLTDKYSDYYLGELTKHHISGRLKVAPEHVCDGLLEIMNKPPARVYEKFRERFDQMNAKAGKKQFLVNYFISCHPGSTREDALKLAEWLREKHIHPEQIQDYLPLPMTISACMYYTEKDPFTGKKLHVQKNAGERRIQRSMIQGETRP